VHLNYRLDRFIASPKCSMNYEILALINLRSLVRFIAPGLWPIAGLIP
jgi:hypothetical protein